nr:uncharacterized protein LOC109185560 [Ipomoea trifida]
MVKQLRYCDRKVQFWVLVKGRKNPRKIELRPIINDADIVSLVGEVPPNKEPDIYVEHLFDNQWDYDVEMSRELGDDCLLLEGDEVHEVDCELSEELFRSLEHSEESDGEVTGLDNVFQQTNLNKEGFKFEIGMIFKSTDEFKLAEHTCGDQDENRTVNFGFLAKLYKDDFKLNIEWGRIQFQDHVKAKLKCQALKQLEGDNSEQFKLLNNYREELRRSNPGISVMMKVDSQFSVNGRPRWLSSKGSPERRAVVECSLFPGMEHRFCVRHMHANFVKDELWAVCKATTEAQYKRQMEKLKALNAKAAEWLDARDAKHYCKAYFITFPKTDLLLNNLCESWNSNKALRAILRRYVLRYTSCLKRKRTWHAVELEEVVAGMEEVVAEEVQVEWQFEDIAVEAQVSSFVLDEMVSTLAL